jgi:16S rRNA (cytidine1402-2'-O)-methyltransferase
VCREISKLHDTTHRGTLGELAAEFAAVQARGEIVIVVAGKPAEQRKEHQNKYKQPIV